MSILGLLKQSPKFNKTAYGLMMAMVALLGFVKLLLLADALGIAGFGGYVFFITLEAYLMPLLTLGLMESVFRQYPILLGRGDYEKAYKLRNKSLLTIARLLFYQILFVLIFCLLCVRFGDKNYVLWVSVGAVHVIANVFFLWGLREIRSRLKSLEYALAMVLKFILDIVILAVASWDFNIFNYLLAEAIVLLFICVFVFLRISSVRVEKEAGLLDGMIKSGFTLFGASTIGTLSVTGDRLILGASLHSSMFSLYAFNGIIFQAGLSLANIIHQYIQPVVMQAYGREGFVDGIYYRLRRLFLFVLILGCLVSPFLWLISDYLVNRYYKDFHLDPLLFFSFLFAAVLHVGNFFSLILIAANEIKTLYICQSISATFLLLSFAIGFLYDASLGYFGTVFLISRFMSLLLLLRSSRRLLNIGRS